MIRIGIFIFDGVEELDFVGPYEVFTMINEVCRSLKQPQTVEVQLISETGAMVTGAKNMRIMADTALDTDDLWDIILIPGGEGTRPLMKNETVLSWICEQAKQAQWTTSVCTGSMVLSKAGLCEGKNITTHHMYFDAFTKAGLAGNLVKGQRYVRDGQLVTAAGVSAGIDMALWLTGEIFSVDFARSVQSAMEYYPDPPYGLESNIDPQER